MMDIYTILGVFIVTVPVAFGLCFLFSQRSSFRCLMSFLLFSLSICASVTIFEINLHPQLIWVLWEVHLLLGFLITGFFYVLNHSRFLGKPMKSVRSDGVFFAIVFCFILSFVIVLLNGPGDLYHEGFSTLLIFLTMLLCAVSTSSHLQIIIEERDKTNKFRQLSKWFLRANITCFVIFSVKFIDMFVQHPSVLIPLGNAVQLGGFIYLTYQVLTYNKAKVAAL